MFTKIKNTTIALFLVGITVAGVSTYRDVDTQIRNMDNRLRTVGEIASSIIGQDSTIAAYYQMPNIRVADYPESVDMGSMTPENQKLFLDILEAVENGENRAPYNGTMDDLYSVITHLGYYYGSEKYACDMFVIYETELNLNLDAFEHLERNKVLVDARVDEMLSTLKEGSNRFKLFQIAAYIAERITYTDDVIEAVDGLNGNGVCVTYSMLFYKAASRLGIQTYTCYGQIGDAYHAWNMVELDGERYFYDVTWFDTGDYDFQFLHSTDSWGRKFILNNVWGHLYL